MKRTKIEDTVRVIFFSFFFFWNETAKIEDTIGILIGWYFYWDEADKEWKLFDREIISTRFIGRDFNGFPSCKNAVEIEYLIW